MLYLLDANTLITAHQTWYGLQRVPEFWTWLHHHGAAGTLKIPSEIYGEVEGGNDTLAAWMKSAASKTSLLLAETGYLANVQNVLHAYGPALSDADLITIGMDPFLIAAALGHHDRCVVSAEVSKPTRTGPRRHVPDVCADLGVICMHPIQFIAALDFTTGWAG